MKEHCLFNAVKLKTDKEYQSMFKWLTSYTMMGKNKHDDVPDAFAMLAEFTENLVFRSVSVAKDRSDVDRNN